MTNWLQHLFVETRENRNISNCCNVYTTSGILKIIPWKQICLIYKYKKQYQTLPSNIEPENPHWPKHFGQHCMSQANYAPVYYISPTIWSLADIQVKDVWTTRRDVNLSGCLCQSTHTRHCNIAAHLPEMESRWTININFNFSRFRTIWVSQNGLFGTSTKSIVRKNLWLLQATVIQSSPMPFPPEISHQRILLRYS